MFIKFIFNISIKKVYVIGIMDYWIVRLQKSDMFRKFLSNAFWRIL